MTAPRVPRRGEWGRYRPQPPIAAVPLVLAGLYAVHAHGPASATTQIYYCEPETGRCSCGAATGSCPHIAAARARIGPARAARTPTVMEEAA